MTDRLTTLERLVARLRAMLPGSWAQGPGKAFRKSVQRIQENTEDYQVGERAKEVGGLLWRKVEGVASIEQSQAMSNFAAAEEKRIDAAFKERTADDRARV